jgi:cytochrome P450
MITGAEEMIGIRSIVSTEYDAHRRFRRIFAAAFSDRAVKKQESIFHQHIDHMMARLEEAAVQGKPIDLVQIFNYMTFDIMGDLCFGQPLGMLENDSYSPWVESVFASVKVIPLIQIIQYYPLLENMFNWFEPKAISNMRNDHFQYTADRVDLRLTKGSDKPDIWNLAVVAGSKERLSVDEMHSNAEFFMLAGSETTATHLSGFMYQLFRNPDKTKRLMEEIRSAVTGDEDLDMERIADLKYLNACQ